MAGLRAWWGRRPDGVLCVVVERTKPAAAKRVGVELFEFDYRFEPDRFPGALLTRGAGVYTQNAAGQYTEKEGE